MTVRDSAFAAAGISTTGAVSIRRTHPAPTGAVSPPMPLRVSMSRCGVIGLNPVTGCAAGGEPTGLASHETVPDAGAAATDATPGPGSHGEIAITTGRTVASSARRIRSTLTHDLRYHQSLKRVIGRRRPARTVRDQRRCAASATISRLTSASSTARIDDLEFCAVIAASCRR